MDDSESNLEKWISTELSGFFLGAISSHSVRAECSAAARAAGVVTVLFYSDAIAAVVRRPKQPCARACASEMAVPFLASIETTTSRLFSSSAS